MSHKSSQRQGVWQWVAYGLATGLGSGLSPYMPGTCGTLLGVIIYVVLFKLMAISIGWPAYVCSMLLLTVLAIVLSEHVARDLGQRDPQCIVIDEIVGLGWTLVVVWPHWFWLIIGFLLFRFFDIVKPWPIGWLDKHMVGGLGIVMDDVAAGFCAGLLLYGLQQFFSALF